MASIARNIQRIADHFDPPPPDIVGTDYIAERMGRTSARISQMARSGKIPASCIVPARADSEPWNFYRTHIDQWLATRT